MTECRKMSHRDGMIRKVLAGAIIGAAVTMLGLTNGVAQTEAPSPRVLTFSDHQPSDRMRTRFLKDVLFPAIEKESEGRLKIEDHWDGELAAAYDALGAVSKGSVDMATTVPEYTAKELPLHQIFKSFPVGPTADKQIEFFQRVYDEVPAFTEELANNNIVPIFFGTGYPVAFYSTARVDNLDGLAGGKWRSASFWHLDFLNNVGATPVRVHWGPEVYAALKDGTLDGLMVNIDSGYFLNVHDTSPNVLYSEDLWLGHVYPLTMNKDVWGGLSQEDKAAIQRAVASSYQSLGAVMTESFDAQLETLRNAGAHIRVLGTDEITRFAKATRYQDVQDAWAKQKESEGVTNASAVLDDVSSVMTDIMN